MSAEANLLLVVIVVRLVRVFSTRVSLPPAVATASTRTRGNGRSNGGPGSSSSSSSSRRSSRRRPHNLGVGSRCAAFYCWRKGYDDPSVSVNSLLFCEGGKRAAAVSRRCTRRETATLSEPTRCGATRRRRLGRPSPRGLASRQAGRQAGRQA